MKVSHVVLHWRVCNKFGCGNLSPNPRCDSCTAQAEAKRGTAAQRGYLSRGHIRFRRAVLRRDKLCVLCKQSESTDADHFPLDRRTLILRGQNPNDPAHGRGLCSPCHKRETAARQPGGWNAR